jgi:hypothetical protein
MVFITAVSYHQNPVLVITDTVCLIQPSQPIAGGRPLHTADNSGDVFLHLFGASIGRQAHGPNLGGTGGIRELSARCRVTRRTGLLKLRKRLGRAHRLGLARCQ